MSRPVGTCECRLPLQLRVEDTCSTRSRCTKTLGFVQDRFYGQVIGYRVGGMPDGKTARIANFGAPNRNDWRIMRINADNTQTDWTGHYKTIDEALAALQQD